MRMMDIARPVSSFGLLIPSLAALGLVVGCSAANTDAPPTTASADDSGATEDNSVVIPPEEDGGVVDPPPVDSGTPTAETGPVAPEYPPGPYGKTLGATIPNLSWKGYRDGTGPWTDIKLGDYYDPEGKLGHRAIKIGMAALW